MGNNPSTPAKSERAGSQPHSAPASAPHRGGAREREHNEHAVRQVPRRRESLQTLSSAKATAAPPSTSTIVASSSSSSSQARSIPGPQQQQSGHSRTRSNTTTPRSTAHDTAASSPKSIMGAEQSRTSARPPSRGQSLKSPTPPLEPRLSPASRPVDVPISASSQGRSFQPSPLDPSAPPSEAFHLPPSSYSRPPRLPLPIEEEVHTPGSPIISQVDVSSPSPVDGTEPEFIPRRSSVVSSNLDDDDDDREGFEGYSTDTAGPKVPTIIEWRNCKPTDKIYVTGTFTNWERKFRLFKDGPSKHKDALSALLQLPPGTHHIKFIMNGDMMTSEDLPTTVDYTNILVNYVEVSLDDLPTAENPNPAPVTPAPAPAPIAEPPAPSRPLDIRPRPGAPDTDPAHQQPRNTVPRESLLEEAAPPLEPTEPAATPSHASPTPTPPTLEKQAEEVEKPRTPSIPTITRQPSKEYTAEIPAYLLDLDTWIPPSKENDPSPAHQAARFRFERASAAAESQPAPPSLPLFLSKSILNGTTPMKDDSSVLIMPNHTVLNHLATTNIKQGVLATSATTRYKRKFLTTIMYKPRSDEGD